MTITPEQIMAYVDGELDEETRGRITLAARADLDLAQRIAAERALRDRLKAHFAPIAEAEVPVDWVDRIRAETAPAQVIDMAAARDRKAASGPRWWSNRWAGAAMAASLVLGIFVGSQWQGAGQSGPITAHDGALLASGELASALDMQLASAQEDAPIRMLGTFQRDGGDICRVFAGRQVSGVACHEAGGWQLQHVLPGSARTGTAYRQAGSHEAELMAIAQAMAAGEPLDAAQEREAKAKGWR